MLGRQGIRAATVARAAGTLSASGPTSTSASAVAGPSSRPFILPASSARSACAKCARQGASLGTRRISSRAASSAADAASQPRRGALFSARGLSTSAPALGLAPSSPVLATPTGVADGIAAEAAAASDAATASVASSEAAAEAMTAPGESTIASAVSAQRWTPLSQRVGLMGIKQGMISYFLPSGIHVPATVVHVQHNEVLQQIHRDPATDERGPGQRNELTSLHARARRAYIALQVYAGRYAPSHPLARRSKNQLKGHIREFRVSSDALLPPGTQLSALHFVPGQQVDVVGTTKGKGFQGAMKRHGFKGLRASHGVSISHRSHGSTGQHQDPGRVFPGKKMAGRMGGRQSSVHNVTVLRVDVPKQLLFLKGQLPGPIGSLVLMTDAKRSLIGRARNAVAKGRTRDGSLAQGTEDGSAYLPPGIEDLPFPAATRQMEKGAPAVVEVAAL